MKKIIKILVTVIVVTVLAAPTVLFSGYKLDLLPPKLTAAVDAFCNTLFAEEKEAEQKNDSIPLSTLTESPLLENFELLVPKNAYIPSAEEIKAAYSGLYADSVVVTFTNYDIILQEYGIELSSSVNFENFCDSIIINTKEKLPNIVFDTTSTFKKGELDIPTVELFIERETKTSYSFMAFLNINGKFFTLTLNSADPYVNTALFFEELLNGMTIK